MPNILAIDTSTSACSVALSIDNHRIEEYLLAPQSHTQHLLPIIDRMLAHFDTKLTAIDAIALTQGPGSFTGLRIALGVVQGLAYGAEIPVVGVSTLLTMATSAERLLNIPDQCLIVPALDARMNEVYWSAFTKCEGETLTSLQQDSVSGKDCTQLNRILQQGQQNNLAVIGVGDGWQTPVLAPYQHFLAGCHADFYPRALDLLTLAESMYAQGEGTTIFDFELTYVRNEIHWKKRERMNSRSI